MYYKKKKVSGNNSRFYYILCEILTESWKELYSKTIYFLSVNNIFRNEKNAL